MKKNLTAHSLSLCAVLLAFSPLRSAAQDQHSEMQGMPGMDMSEGAMNSAEKFLMSETSGTAFQPKAWPMPMIMTKTGGWSLMWMGQAFIVDTQQSGPRGGDKLYSVNWGMLAAVHRLGRGSVMLRGMVSLDPATVTERRYPLLFQTGETAFGQPIVDGQHPHDLFMEVSVQYAHPLGEHATWNVYYAPVGEPALGPVAYPHRASAMELPQAAIGHHWEDSTHIADNVVTTGVSYRKVRLEASGFYGREPNENRWNFDYGAMDSWSTRFSVLPGENWAAQISVGRLHNPEEAQPGDVVRTTASVQYIRPINHHSAWATTLIWGSDHKTDEHLTTNTVTAETVVPLSRKNFITGRYEWSQRDELFSNTPQLAIATQVFQVNALTAGYTRDVALFRDVETGIGANVSSYVIDSALQPYYGDHPWGVNVFLRVRLKKQ